MNTRRDSGFVSFIAGEELAINRIVKLSAAGTVTLADAGEDSIGVTVNPAASGSGVTVKLWNAEGTFLIEAADTFDAGANLYPADDGKISDTVSGVPVAVANEACTAAAQAIEVIATSAAQALTSSVLADPAALTQDDLTDNSGGSAGTTLAEITAPGTVTPTFSANDPAITPDGAVTIADGSAPTVAELLEFCVELNAKNTAANTAIGVLKNAVASLAAQLAKVKADNGAVRTSHISALDILEANGMRSES